MIWMSQARGELLVHEKVSVLHASEGSMSMWCPVLEPQRVGPEVPPPEAVNCALWHWVRPFAGASPGSCVDGGAMLKVSKFRRIRQMSSLALQTEKEQAEVSVSLAAGGGCSKERHALPTKVGIVDAGAAATVAGEEAAHAEALGAAT
jgi:hypothetical protein